MNIANLSERIERNNLQRCCATKRASIQRARGALVVRLAMSTLNIFFVNGALVLLLIRGPCECGCAGRGERNQDSPCCP